MNPFGRDESLVNGTSSSVFNVSIKFGSSGKHGKLEHDLISPQGSMNRHSNPIFVTN